MAIQKFLQRFPLGQVLSLGAGFDTTFFRLHGLGITPTLFVEVDFHDVIARKKEIITGDPQLRAAQDRYSGGGR